MEAHHPTVATGRCYLEQGIITVGRNGHYLYKGREVVLKNIGALVGRRFLIMEHSN